MSDFKFNIGDIVRHVINEEAGDTGWPLMGAGQCRMIVIERLTQECQGGVQRHYKCNCVGRSGQIVGAETLTEMELVASEPFGKREKEEKQPKKVTLADSLRSAKEVAVAE